MNAYRRTLYLLSRIGSGRGVWCSPTGRYWTDDPATGAPVDATDIIAPLVTGGLADVNRAELPIARGPHRGSRWLRLTRAGRQAEADAVRRDENAVCDPRQENPR